MVFRTGKNHLENIDYITVSDEPLPYSLNFRYLAPVLEKGETSGSTELETSLKKKKEIKILIVEDNPEIRYYLKQSLKPDYEIIEAAMEKQDPKWPFSRFLT